MQMQDLHVHNASCGTVSEKYVLLDYWQQDIYSHCHSLTGTAELTWVAPAGPIYEFQQRP